MQSTKLNALKSLASLATFRKLALMATLLAVTTALILIGATTQAQASNGAVPNLQLSSASPGELTIAWDAPDPAPSDYRVIWAKQDLGFLSYKNSNEANRGNEYPSGSERSITLPGLAKGQTFKVQARARYTSGGQNNGPWSGPWTGTITTRVKDDTPAAPTGLTASEVTHDSVSLSWTAPSRGTVTGYRVLRGADANSLSTMTDDTGSTSPEYTDSTVDAETTYHYAVLALSQDGDGAQSGTTSATTPAAPPPVPSAPTGLVATPSHDQVSLSWDDPQNSSITGYQIWRGADATSLASITADTGSTTTTYVDDTVTAETAYHYAVSAINSTGTGDQSTTVSTTTPAAPQEKESKDPPKGTPVPDRGTRTDPGAPLNLAVVVGDTQLTFTWDPPTSDGGSAIVRYNYLFGPSGETQADDNHGTDPTGSQTLTKTGLTNGTAYTFKVRAITNFGGSTTVGAYTAVVTGTPVANTTATGVPAITVPNVFRVPAVLTANKGTIADSNGLPEESTFTWQWVRVDGMTETNITGATAKTYTLIAADVGKTINVKASFTDTASNSEGPLTSPATSTILAATTCNAPTYTGGATQIWTSKIALAPSMDSSGNTTYYGFSTSDSKGALSSTMFTAGSQHTVNKTLATSSFLPPAGRLVFGTRSEIPAAVRKQLTLYVCSAEFPFSDATPDTTSPEVLKWSRTDLDWNDQAERTLYISRDQTPPTVASVNFSRTALVIAFTEYLGTSASLANSAFTVKKTPADGTELTVTLSGTPTIRGKTVTLTLGAALVTTGRVKVSYTKPTSGTGNKLVDKFSNEVASFTDEREPQSFVTLPNNTLLSNINQNADGTTPLTASSRHHVIRTTMAIDAPHGMDIDELKVRVSDWDPGDSMYARLYSGDNNNAWLRVGTDPLVRYRPAIVRDGVARFFVEGTERRINPDNIRERTSGQAPPPHPNGRPIYIVVLTRTSGEFNVRLTSSGQNDAGTNARSKWSVTTSGGKYTQLLLTGNAVVPPSSNDPVPPLPPQPPLTRPAETNEPRYGNKGRFSYTGIRLGRDYRNLEIAGAFRSVDWLRVALSPGQIYRIYPRGAALGGGTLQDVQIALYTQQVICIRTEIPYCEGNAYVALNPNVSVADVALNESGALAGAFFDGRDNAYVEFKTPCLEGSTGCAANQALDSLDMPVNYYIPIKGYSDGVTANTYTFRIETRTAFEAPAVENPRSLFRDIPSLASTDDAVHNGRLQMRYDRDWVSVSLGEPETCTVTLAGRGDGAASSLRMRVFIRDSRLSSYPAVFEHSGSSRTVFTIESKYDRPGSYIFEVYSATHAIGDYKLTVSGCKAESTSVPPPAVVTEDDVANGTPVPMTVGTSYTRILNHDRDRDYFVVQLSGKGGTPWEDGKLYRYTIRGVSANFDSEEHGNVRYGPAENLSVSMVETDDCLNEKGDSHPWSLSTDESFRPVKYATQQQGEKPGDASINKRVISYTRPEQINKMGTQCYLFGVSSFAQGDGATGGYLFRITEVAATD